MNEVAIYHYGTAKAFVQSAFAMMISRARFMLPDDTTLFLSFHLLCGFAAELYLKAYLLERGVSEKDLRNPKLRHDLSNLFELSTQHGLRGRKFKELIDFLAPKHRSYEYRYMQTNSSYRAMHLVPMFEFFSRLDRAVDIAVGASKFHGRLIGSGWSFPSDGPWRLPMTGGSAQGDL